MISKSLFDSTLLWLYHVIHSLTHTLNIRWTLWPGPVLPAMKEKLEVYTRCQLNAMYQWEIILEIYIYIHTCACMLRHLIHVQLCENPMDCSPPGSSVHGILQVRILEWVAMLSSRGSSWPRDWTCACVSHISCIGRRVLLPLASPGKPVCVCVCVCVCV